MNKPNSPPALLRNIAVVAVLGAVVFWLGHESAERGVFKFKRDVQISSEKPSSPEPAVPTPTPLPAHFPSIQESDLEISKNGYLSLSEAYISCWKLKQNGSEIAPDGEITPLEAHRLFGKIKKREVLEKSETTVKLGLLFDTAVFVGGAAGSATETDGRWTELQVRAAGHMLRCDSPNRCECL